MLNVVYLQFTCTTGYGVSIATMTQLDDCSLLVWGLANQRNSRSEERIAGAFPSRAQITNPSGCACSVVFLGPLCSRGTLASAAAATTAMSHCNF